MAKLNKTDSAILAANIGKPVWEVMMKLAAMTINDLNGREVPGTDAFETLRALHIREGQVRGIREFFDGVERGDSLTGGLEPEAREMR
jgi:hypothetical protein